MKKRKNKIKKDSPTVKLIIKQINQILEEKYLLIQK